MSTTTTVTEKTEIFQNLTEGQQKIIVQLMAKSFGSKDYETFYRIFELGNPKIVLRYENDKMWFRVHDDSVKLMTLLTKKYGKA